MTVLDASAVLAFLQGEDGRKIVERQLSEGSSIGAANWSEVAQKIRQHGRRWNEARALLLSYEPVIEDVTADDAEWAARHWRKGEGLSLADRLCLALGSRLDTEVLTADSRWGSEGRIIQLR